MKKKSLVIISIFGVILAFGFGYFWGHRSASILCLKESASDLHQAYFFFEHADQMTVDVSIPHVQLRSAINSLSEAKVIMETPYKTHLLRHGSYEPQKLSQREELEQMDKTIARWENILEDERNKLPIRSQEGIETNAAKTAP